MGLGEGRIGEGMGKLSAVKVKNLGEKGVYEDGDGLRLVIRATGTKSWVLRFQLGNRRRDLGLGGYPGISLQEARQLAADQRQLLRKGVDPFEHRKAIRDAAEQVTLVNTFKACAEAYIESHRHGWKNAKHAWQWSNTLERFAYPVCGDKDVSEIDTSDIKNILSPIWNTKTETATRVRSRIENILDAAKALGFRDGENPARWRGHLDKIFPAKPKSKRVVHHPAMPFQDVPSFFERLNKSKASSARALKVTIHTALRTSEVLGGEWSEVDLKKKIWTVPAARMKMEKDHIVPLTDSVVAIFTAQVGLSKKYIFPGAKPGETLSNTSMLMLMRRMKSSEYTVHGFRSSFTDYLSEMHNVSRDVREMALAHAIESDVEGAYRRGDLFRKRKVAMQIWSDYLDGVQTPASWHPDLQSQDDVLMRLIERLTPSGA